MEVETAAMFASLSALFGFEDLPARVESASSEQRSIESDPHPYLGPVQVISITPFCAYEDVLAWAAASSQMNSMMMVDTVWRQLILSHFAPVAACVAELRESAPLRRSDCSLTLLDVSDLAEGSADKVYGSLHRASPKPFVIDKRGRLVLEIHELKEWDQHQKEFLLQRQAYILASALKHDASSTAICQRMNTTALEMISLMALLGNGKHPKLSEIPEIRFGPSAEQETQSILQRRMQKRREWWQL